MLGTENRWLVALLLLWLVVPAWLLHLATDVTDLVDDPQVATLRTLAVAMPLATAAITYLHARANGVSHPLAKAALATVVLAALGWVAWVWTVDDHRGSGVVLSLPLCLVAVVAGALAGTRPSDGP